VRALAERGTLLDTADLDRLLGLPAPGVDELIGLLEAVRLGEESGCRRVVIDTAPTAHALRLLAMPGALRRLAALLAAMRDRHRAVAAALVGGVPPDAADELAGEVEREARRLEELIRDPGRAAFVWVLLPEALAVAETADAVEALAAAGIAPGAMVRELIINRLTPPPEAPCRFCRRRRRAEAAAIAELAERFPEIPIRAVPEREREPRGRAALRALWKSLVPVPPPPRRARRPQAEATEPSPPPPAWIDRVAPEGLRLLFVAGKGGVGKTTCAAALGLAAARRRLERPVLLLSTDPAHSLGDALGTALDDRPRRPPGAPANLRSRELDAAAAFAAHRETLREALDEAFAELLGAPGGRAGIDAPFDRRLLETLLEGIPPGLDELVAMVELTAALEETDRPGLVVVDTAPTGHALRLLDAPELAREWSHALMAVLLRHREVTGLGRLGAELLALARGARRLAEALRDPDRTRFVVVARAAELPRRETVRLLAALGRRRIAVAALAVNALTPESEGCRRCAARSQAERRELERMLRAAARAAARPSAILLAPAAIPAPIGPAALTRWARRWRFEPLAVAPTHPMSRKQPTRAAGAEPVGRLVATSREP
jgi:arsenite-transporting ATPase